MSTFEFLDGSYTAWGSHLNNAGYIGELKSMSQTSSDSGALIAAFQIDLTETFAIWSMTALAAYEYILTVNQEVAMIWRRKWSLVTWLFVTNRYIMIAVIIWGVSPDTAQSCFPGTILGDILSLAQFVVFAVFSALRVFAIWDRNVIMTVVVLVLNLVPVATNMYLFKIAKVIFTVDPVFGAYCGNDTGNISASTNFKCKFTLGTRLSVIVADIIVLALTLQKTFGHRIDAIRAGVQTPLSALLLRDGTVYFATLLSLNIVQVLIRTVPSLQDSSDPVSQLIETLTPILISRFLLNLRQLGEPENETQSRFNSRVSIPGFRVPTLESVVGNMGADLDHGPTKEVDEGADIPVNGGHLAEAALDGISENGPGVLVTENVYGNQELPSHMA